MTDYLNKCRNNLIPFARAVYPGFIAPPHVMKIAEKLEEVEKGNIRRLILTVPPRHSKSLLSSQIFPAWFLGKNPRKKIMLSAHTQMLASDFGRNVRNFMLTPSYQLIFPESTVSDDSSAKNAFSTTGGGEAFFMGVGGALLGRGADCFPAGTMVETELGAIDIATLYKLKNLPRVLSFDHISNTLCYRRIVATRKIKTNSLCNTTTVNGLTITSTPDHRFYSQTSNGYKPIKNLINESILTHSNISLRFLPNKISTPKIRISKKYKAWAQRLLLQSSVLHESPRNKKQAEMRNLPITGFKKNQAILRTVQTKTQNRTPKNARKMFYLSNNICNEKQQKNILRQEMRGQSTCAAYDRSWEFPLQNREKLCKMVRPNETIDIGTGQQAVCCLPLSRNFQHPEMAGWKNYFSKQFTDSSHRSQSRKQYRLKLNHNVQNLSHSASQIKSDTISTISIYSTEPVDVYDIQVEGTNNFFANKILVHNCAIIDDPVKDAEQADSETYILKLRNWYRETLYTRQMTGGRIIIIMQRWRANDLIGWLLDPNEQEIVEDWKVVNFPAIAEEEDELGRKPGEALWPEKYPVEELEKIRTVLGSRSFNGLYQQKPSVDEGSIFKRDWLHVEKIEYDLLQAPRILALDTAFKTGANNDYSAITIGQKYNQKSIAVLYAEQRKLEFPALVEWVRKLIKDWGIQGVIVEDQASGQSLIQSLRSLSDVPVIAIKIQRGMDKESRVHAITPILEAGGVVFNKWTPSSTREDLFRNLLQFPTGSHDDMVDSFTHLVTYLLRYRQSMKKLTGGGRTGSLPSIFSR